MVETIYQRCDRLIAENDELREQVIQLRSALMGGEERCPIRGLAPIESRILRLIAARKTGASRSMIFEVVYLARPDKAGPVWTGETRLDVKALAQPLHWRRPRKIFVCAHSDLFHEATPDAWIDKVFAIMALCPQHVFQVLTKRPARMRAYMRSEGKVWSIFRAVREYIDEEYRENARFVDDETPWPWPLPNVWLGVTAERQQEADERVPILLDTPAAKRFVSIEPMLAAVDLRRLSCADPDEVARYERGETDAVCGHYIDALTGDAWDDENGGLNAEVWGDIAENPPRLDWVISGGETGPGARPRHPEWSRSLRDQCAATGVPYFDKQHGDWAPLDRNEGGLWATDTASACRLRIDGTRGDDGWPMQRVGKARAGRLLDGVEHNAFPEG